MSLALLKAIAAEKVQPGTHVVVLYNGIASTEDRPEPVDSLSLLHLSEHLERYSAQDLRKLNTGVPLDTLRLVVDLPPKSARRPRRKTGGYDTGGGRHPKSAKHVSTDQFQPVSRL